jgi:hypothetical protein
MAKQQGSGVVAAARRVSDTQGRFQDVGSQFMTGYNKSLEAKKAREAKAKEGIAKANALMDGFKDDIDYMSFTPEEGKLVKDQVVTWRNAYADLANKASKIEDKTSQEYQILMDEMTGFKNRLVSLKNNIDGRQQLKADFKTDLNDYSTAGFNDEAIAKATVMSATPFSGVNDRGELMWSDEGLGEFSSTGFKMPASNKPAKQAAANIFNEVERQSNARGPLTPALKESLRNKLDNSIGSKENLLSFIADNQFEIFKFDDLDPESDINELRETVLDRLMNGLESTRGAALIEEKPSKPQGGGTTATNVIKPKLVDTVEAMQLLENEENSSVPGPIQLKEFELGPTTDPGSIKVTWDPKRKEWTYLNAVFSEDKSYKTLKEVMISHPSLFYK